MKFQEIKPHPLLQSYIERIFILECNGKLPVEDLKLIVPNARVKLVLPYKNSIIADFNGCRHYSKENKITLIGLSDMPSIVDIGEDQPSGNITVEFSPFGAYRFFNIPFSEIKNAIYSFEDVIGNAALPLEEQLMYAVTVEEKLNMVQSFLLSTFKKQEETKFLSIVLKS